MRQSNAAAIGFMLLGILIFALNDVMGKWLVGTYSVGQVLMFRSAAALLVLLPFVRSEGRWTIFGGGKPGLQAMRVVLATAEVALFYWAVAYLPLADAMTYYLAAPIYVAAMSPFLLGEKVGWRRWSAIAVGFGGVLVALQPTAASFTLPSLIAFSGSFAFALMMITGRVLKGVPDLTLIFWQMFGALVAGAALAPIGWVTPSMRDLGLLALLGIVANVAHVCITRALKLGDATTVTPFTYTTLIWAILFGYLVFGDVPESRMLLGAGVIVGAGIYILWRERVRKAPPTIPGDLV